VSHSDSLGQPIKNRLLAALPGEQYERLRPLMELVSLASSEILYKASTPIHYVYFPNNSVISLVSMTVGRRTAEVGLVGREGMVGLPVFLGATTSPNHVIVQVGDGAMRMKARAFKDEIKRGGAMQGLLLRYTQALINQVSQTVVCNNLHTVEKRLCRWLLMIHDRVRSDDFFLTHEFVSNMLGVRRAGVSIAAGNLQQAGLIRYSHGKITILNRSYLESTACGCYRIIAK
jgi:CRP-like cAMP-binding protein